MALDCICPIELEIKDTTDTDIHVGLLHIVTSAYKFTIRVVYERNFTTMFLLWTFQIYVAHRYGVFISHLIWYFRVFHRHSNDLLSKFVHAWFSSTYLSIRVVLNYETQRTKRNEILRNATKYTKLRNETQRNETKFTIMRNEMKWIQRNETKHTKVRNAIERNGI